MYGIDGLHVELQWGRDGSVVIYGQHLMPGREYEYWLTIRAPDIPAFRAALGAGERGVAAAWKAKASEIVRGGETSWLDAHGIPYQIHSWVSG